MNIITDNKWKKFKCRNEVPKKILKSRFDYQDAEGSFDGFIFYRKVWYHLDNFLVCGKSSPFPKNWEGYTSDSFFSGVLLRVSPDGERYMIATYIS